MGALTYSDVKKQSTTVFNQFGEKKWIPFAKENSRLERKDSAELQNSGVGKVMVIAAMGASLEGQIETLKKYRDRFHLMTCDKGFGPLVERGVIPDYVMICDANIPAHYLEPYIQHTRGVSLIACCYANLFWTHTWLGPKYFFINKDAIESEEKFIPIMGKSARVIPASSNVSNSMVVFMTGCDDKSTVNWAGYEKYLLVGYDYGWRPNGSYYAWIDPKPKRHYMHQITCLDLNGDYTFSSQNLVFSARWMHQYLSAFKGLPVFNCSERGLLDVPRRGKLEQELEKVSTDPLAHEQVKRLYEATRSSYSAYAATRSAFDQAREALTWR